ncbi:MAG: hypothetical protein AMXMBFR84_04860 [Candidatus Hydrogenedentota bacterium]
MEQPGSGSSEYLDQNARFWQPGYEAPNVESHVFRPYGRILAHELGLTGKGGEKLLEYGCGSGAAAEFFHRKGFNVYGVEISETNVALCRKRMPEIAGHFDVIPATPRVDDVFFGGGFAVVTAIQCLYYLSESDLQLRLQSLYAQMTPGAVLYATMIGARHHYFAHSTPAAGGMRTVCMHTPRIHIEDHFVLFTESEDQLLDRFRLFEACHVGYYAEKYRSDEGEDFHFTFAGRKRLA